ncbi:acylphosphatase [Halomonas sp. I5-271120]|uniref:acylphosphatase n=1 Tax=Halomonas sp. I5-271120 TaxID=3061632 RepID=UPI002714563D|nr:acylphosphatase [Halomonas sp. I5-271120]
MSKCCLKALVTGKVQGVWYRKATQEQALKAGVAGHARNLADGRVEVLLCGESSNVDAVARWLWEGPPNARVTHVAIEGVDWQDHDAFITL